MNSIKLGLAKGIVELHEYRDVWKDYAHDAIDTLKHILKDDCIDIQHFGSTSIETMISKPIIDLVVGMKHLDDVLKYIKELEEVGFYYRKEASRPHEYLFASGSYYENTGDLQTHFIHVVEYGSNVWSNYLLFRDYLRSHPKAVEDYTKLKIQLKALHQTNNDRSAYTEGKNEFVHETLQAGILERYVDKDADIIAHKKQIVIDDKDTLINSITHDKTNNNIYMDIIILGDTSLVDLDYVIKGYIECGDNEFKLIALPRQWHLSNESIQDVLKNYLSMNIKTIDTFEHYHIRTMERIDAGWSFDQKFKAITDHNEVFFMRIYDLRKGERVKQGFILMQELADHGISMIKPIEIGQCEEGIYTLQSWLEGFESREYIPQQSFDVQYQLGISAGKMLQNIHRIPAPKNERSWSDKFNRKVSKKIEDYLNNPIHVEHFDVLIDFINEHRYLFDDRPQTYHHGDYHTGNMMIDDGQLVIIDFDRFDFGDPWEEFNRIVWCAQLSPHFASGMIDGYFDDHVPDNFWPLLLLYIGSNLLSSVPWAHQFGDEQVKIMLDQAQEVTAWYNNFTSIIPSWYNSHKDLDPKK